MKKMMCVLLACCLVAPVWAAQKSQILKLTEMTKKQQKQAEAELEEGSGDGVPFATDKGLWWIYIEHAGLVKVLNKSKIGDCVKVTASADELTGKYIMDGTLSKVKCPR